MAIALRRLVGRDDGALGIAVDAHAKLGLADDRDDVVGRDAHGGGELLRNGIAIEVAPQVGVVVGLG